MLFAAVVLAATVAIGPEVTSWSMARPTPFSPVPSTALSLVRDSRGLVIAFSSGPSPSHIFVARLDETLRVIDGTLRDIPPVSDPNFDAAYPQLAVVDGNAVLLWRERQRTAAVAANTIFVARVGESPLWSTACSDATRIRLGPGTNGNVMVADDPVLVTIDPSGRSSFAGIQSGSLDDAVFFGSHVAYVTRSVTIPTAPPCHCYPHTLCFCPPPPPPHFDAHVIVNGTVRAALTLTPATSGPQMSIGSDGTNDLVAWASSNGNVVAARVLADGKGDSMEQPLTLGRWGDPLPLDWVPSIATDGERWLIVWQKQRDWVANHEILAAVVTPDGNVRPFGIASDESDRLHPTVAVAGKGLFVVGYEIVSGNERLLAGRYVDLNEPHHRAAPK